jgi:diadenylate cyclase
MEKVHTIIPKNSGEVFDNAISMVASGSPLRDAVDMIIAAQNGALICIGDVKTLLELGNGGFRIDVPFTPQRLFELSKMDGAILLSSDGSQIVCANFHLNPDPNLLTYETGMRHRTAARTSAQTKATVIAISKRRVQTTVYCNGEGITLDSDEILLSKGNQGILALQNAKNSLEKAAIRLTFLELDDIVTAADVAKVLSRYVNLLNLAVQTERFVNFLGNNSGLLEMQLEDIMSGVVESFLLIIRDYAVSSAVREVKRISKALAALPREELTTVNVLTTLGYAEPKEDEDHLSSRGFRVISRLSVVDEAAAARIIEEYGSLSALVSDSKDGFDRLGNTGLDNIRAIAASFKQLRSTL